MTSTDIHTLAGAYVLDAVDDLERAAFDRHLADCESCRLDVDELREAGARLADSTWSVPPPRLRTDVLAAIGRTRQLAPVEAPRPAVPSRPAAWRRRTLTAAAAVILAAGTGTAVWTVQDGRLREQRDVVAGLQIREARAREILAAPDVVFRTAPIIGGGKVTVASAPSRNAGVILMAADAPPADGKVFQLWTIRGTTPASAGVLAAGQTSVVQIVDGLPGTAAVAVTREPVNGSAAPTLPPVSSVQLT